MINLNEWNMDRLIFVVCFSSEKLKNNKLNFKNIKCTQ